MVYQLPTSVAPCFTIICLLFFSVSFTMSEMAFIQDGEVFKQGITLYDVPPASINVSLPSISISSKVSKQSLTNAGQAITKFLIPFDGISFKISAVFGNNHLSRPN